MPAGSSNSLIIGRLLMESNPKIGIPTTMASSRIKKKLTRTINVENNN
jgi:hypothetical protein